MTEEGKENKIKDVMNLGHDTQSSLPGGINQKVSGMGKYATKEKRRGLIELENLFPQKNHCNPPFYWLYIGCFLN